MQTIKELILQKNASLKAERQVQLEDRIDAVYSRFPELKKIDESIVEIRRSQILAIMTEDSAPLPLLEKREKELIEERDAFIKENRIDPDFDKDRPTCDKCNDTGFETISNGRKIVCQDCMSLELTKCYNMCGLSDYSLYTLKGYKHDYFGDKSGRKAVFESIKKIFESVSDKKHGLYLYTSGVQTGKTYLAVILVKYAILEGVGAAYVKAENLYGYSDDEMDFIKKCDFLVIDDYEAEITRDWKKSSAINAVFEARSAASIPTLIVSNSSKEELSVSSEGRVGAKISRATVL